MSKIYATCGLGVSCLNRRLVLKGGGGGLWSATKAAAVIKVSILKITPPHRSNIVEFF